MWSVLWCDLRLIYQASLAPPPTPIPYGGYGGGVVSLCLICDMRWGGGVLGVWGAEDMSPAGRSCPAGRAGCGSGADWMPAESWMSRAGG